MAYLCKYCDNRSFECKLTYEKHMLICMFKHKSNSQKRKELETIEPKLTEYERDKLIRNMFYKIKKMEITIKELKDDIVKLKKNKKINILEHLNSENGIIPILPLKEWIFNIDINQTHLFKVFETDLVQGIIDCLKQAILIHPNIPFCSFIQKNKTLFVYRIPLNISGSFPSSASSSEFGTEEKELLPKWEIINHDEMKKALNLLSFRFLQIFIKWKQDNYIPYNEEWQEKTMIYSKKIMGQDICENTRAHRIQDWLINTIQRNFIEYEIV